MARPSKRNIKAAHREFDAAVRHLLEWTTVGFLYQPPDDSPSQVEHLYEIMAAEGYLAESQGRYSVTAKGRQHLIHLQRNPITRWCTTNYQWLTATLIATASVLTAITGLIIISTGQ